MNDYWKSGRCGDLTKLVNDEFGQRAFLVTAVLPPADRESVFDGLMKVATNKDLSMRAIRIFENYHQFERKALQIGDALKESVSPSNFIECLEEPKVKELFNNGFINCDTVKILTHYHHKNIAKRVSKILLSAEKPYDINPILANLTKKVDQVVFTRFLGVFEKDVSEKTLEAVRKSIRSSADLEILSIMLKNYQDSSLEHIKDKVLENITYDPKISFVFNNLKIRKILQSYKEENIVCGIERFIELTNPIKAIELSSIFNEPKISDYVNKFGDAFHVAELYYILDTNKTKTFEILDLIDYPFLGLLVQCDGDQYLIAQVYNKYKHVDGLNQYLADNKKRILGYEELLSESAYDVISKSKDPIKDLDRIGSAGYSITRNIIQDGKIMSYDELDLVKKTLVFVHKIHEKRNPEALQDLTQGFYDELNRSVAQGSKDKEKKRYLREYCREVTKKMMDNAVDLMVMHDA